MKRRRAKDQRPGHARILDAWAPPRDAGDPIGCVATSYTFSAAFFEEECLSRFVGMESDAVEDGASFLVEREEKFAKLICAAALVDQHHAKGLRSLRWDLLAARPPTGILHAKVSLLLWTQAARLIIGSANLTADGYRRNREVFGVLDYGEQGNAPIEVLREITAFLREIIRHVDPGADPNATESMPAVGRWNRLLDHVERRSEDWARTAPPARGNPRIRPVLVAPGRPSFLDSVREAWPEGTPPQKAWVVSPFYDPPEAENAPARQIWNILRQRGEAQLTHVVPGKPIEGTDRMQLFAPASLRWTPPNRPVEVRFERLGREGEDPDESRPLHAKAYWFEGGDSVLYVLGSSNFTSAGLGLGRTQNIEANLAYSLNKGRNASGHRALQQAWPRHVSIRGEPQLVDPTADREDEPGEGLVVLPGFFGSATYGCDDKGAAWVEFVFRDRPPGGWVLLPDEEDETFTDSAAWKVAGSPAVWRLPWARSRPPAGFRVRIDGAVATAWWPANVGDATSLPPPDELRDLPLEVLIEILTSAKPLHVALRAWLRARDRDSANGQEVSQFLNPLRRFDSPDFIIPRTRRVVWALAGLRERLQRPIPSMEALHWRLKGPVGVDSVARAVTKEAASAEERLFLLAELMLETVRAQPKAVPGGPSESEIRNAIREVAESLRQQIEQDSPNVAPSFRSYLANACAALS